MAAKAGNQTTSSPECDWSLCALCQQRTREALRCPANAKHKVSGSTYKTLAENLKKFNDLGALPTELVSRLQVGPNLMETFKEKNAQFHESCRLRYSSSRLKRVKPAPVPECPTPNVEAEPARKAARREIASSKKIADECCICEKIPPEHELRKASSWDIDKKFRNSATILQDHKLLGKLSAGDMMAYEMKYHTNCLNLLHKRAQRAAECNTELPTDGHEANDITALQHGRIFAELTSFMEEVRDSSTLRVFKLADLVRMYQIRQGDFSITAQVHSTRLKERLLSHFGDLEAHMDGRDVLLTFSSDLTSALKSAYDNDEEAIYLAKAARIVRRDLLPFISKFSHSYKPSCQADSVPETLLTLVQMILQGPAINNQVEGTNQASLSLAQLISFNVCRKEGSKTRHSKEREPPIPVYVGMSIHAQTRKKELVETMHALGLGISYNRVLEISGELAGKACEHFKQENVVCPLKLRSGLFTTAAVDNIDHNPSSTTAKDSFHGTAISIFQLPEKNCPGIKRSCVGTVPQPASAGLTVPELPHFFTSVPPFVLKLPVEPPPTPVVPSTYNTGVYDRAIENEKGWMDTLYSTPNGDSTCESISWGAYHAEHQQQHTDLTPGISSLLPLFQEQSKSPAMMKHSMDLVKSAVDFLNPGQKPVITADQPLFALAKQIQWQLPDLYGQSQMTLMLGGLHTEMAFLKALGTLLRDSGWTDVLTEAKIATSGVADSFLTVGHVARTRHAHQLTICALYSMMKMAYEQYVLSCNVTEETAQVFDEWKSSMCHSSPTFHFWALILELELVLLVFLTSLRDGNFSLYVEALIQMVPRFFSLDQHNYARWLSVHIKDMLELKAVPSANLDEFKKGHFVFQKSRRHFSKMALDQAHEQNNAIIKGEGGAVGLTDSPSALRRWMVSGPEISRVLQELESSLESCRRDTASDERHHENSKTFQETFKQDVSTLISTISHLGNPFLERSGDLITLHGTDIAPVAASQAMKNIKQIGIDQFRSFYEDRLKHGTATFNEPIKRNNITLLSGTKGKRRGTHSKISLLKNNCQLFAGLYVACQTRSGGLKDFFRHENQACPPSLSCEGKLRITTKSALLEILEPLAQTSSDEVAEIGTVILDGAAVVNFLRPRTSKTFNDYASGVFLPYIAHMLQNASRLDIVWDTYRSDSLKNCTRESRGKGKRKRVTPEGCMPSDWSNFLRVDKNKTELFNFLAQKVITINTEKLIITTQGSIVLSNQPVDNDGLSPCSHEEADTRIFVHLSHAIQHHARIVIRTVDTDVVVLAIAAAAHHPRLDIFVAMGVGQGFRNISAHGIASELGRDKARCLPLFHSFTGCDTVSSFNGIGKKTAWDVWRSFSNITEAFLNLSTSPDEISPSDRLLLERFVVLLYDKTSNCHDVNSARSHLFAKMGRKIDNIPPSSEALLQHIKRAVYQGGHIWAQAEDPMPVLPSPSNWGWQFVEDTWRPFWTVLAEASQTCRELLKCACKKGCKNRSCRCCKSGLQCTALCKCSCVSLS